MGKTSFSMVLSDELKEIMDFCVNFIYSEYDLSKAQLVSMLVREAALSYAGLDVESHLVSDSFLLSIIRDKRLNEEFEFISSVGVETYREFIEQSRIKDNDVTFFNSALDYFIKLNSKKTKESLNDEI